MSFRSAVSFNLTPQSPAQRQRCSQLMSVTVNTFHLCHFSQFILHYVQIILLKLYTVCTHSNKSVCYSVRSGNVLRTQETEEWYLLNEKTADEADWVSLDLNSPDRLMIHVLCNIAMESRTSRQMDWTNSSKDVTDSKTTRFKPRHDLSHINQPQLGLKRDFFFCLIKLTITCSSPWWCNQKKRKKKK